MTDPSTRFREARRVLGFTQRELAEALGITERQVRRYEHGEAAIPGPVTILMHRIIVEANHVHDWRCLSCGANPEADVRAALDSIPSSHGASSAAIAAYRERFG